MAIDLEAIRRKVAQLNGVRQSKIQLWKPVAGEHRIRVLPWLDAPVDQPFKEVQYYYIGDNFPLVAPFQFGKPDPIMKLMKSLFATKDPNDKTLAMTLRPSMKAYVPIIERSNEEQGPILWAFTKTSYTRMLSFFLDEDTADWQSNGPNGWDLKVTLTGSTFKTSRGENKAFAKITAIDTVKKQTPLHLDPKVVEKWMASLPKLEDMCEVKSEVEITKILEDYLNSGVKIEAQASDDNTSDTVTRGEKVEDHVEDLVVSTVNESKKSDKKAKDIQSKIKDLDATFDEIIND